MFLSRSNIHPASPRSLSSLFDCAHMSKDLNTLSLINKKINLGGFIWKDYVYKWE